MASAPGQPYFSAGDATIPEDGFDAGPEARHATAALCLYGQPFGFTREHAEKLRWAAYCMDEAGIVHADGDDLRVVADLIEALLPPEMA